MQESGISWDPGKPLTQLVWQVWQVCQTSYPGPLETAIPGGSWNRYSRGPGCFRGGFPEALETASPGLPSQLEPLSLG